MNKRDVNIADSQRRILDAAFDWAECRDLGPAKAKEAWKGLALRVQAELNHVLVMVAEAMTSAQGPYAELGRVRDLFPVPATGTPLEALWVDAMSDPGGVPAYVQACVEAVHSKALDEAAEVCRLMRCRDEFEPEFHDKMLKQAEDRIRALKAARQKEAS